MKKYLFLIAFVYSALAMADTQPESGISKYLSNKVILVGEFHSFDVAKSGITPATKTYPIQEHYLSTAQAFLADSLDQPYLSRMPATCPVDLKGIALEGGKDCVSTKFLFKARGVFRQRKVKVNNKWADEKLKLKNLRSG